MNVIKIEFHNLHFMIFILILHFQILNTQIFLVETFILSCHIKMWLDMTFIEYGNVVRYDFYRIYKWGQIWLLQNIEMWPDMTFGQYRNVVTYSSYIHRHTHTHTYIIYIYIYICNDMNKVYKNTIKIYLIPPSLHNILWLI